MRRWWLWSLPVVLIASMVGVVLAAGPLPIRALGHKTDGGVVDDSSRGWVERMFGGDAPLAQGPLNVLVLGVDTRPDDPEMGSRTDTIMLVQVVPKTGEVKLLSVPRDLYVEVGPGEKDKINAAYAYGGPTLAIKTVQSVTGLPINHVVVVDFGTFDQVIDALGGITIDVPKPILSNKFECPYATQARCDRWKGWRFKKGEQTMNGKTALIYARVRENQLDPKESDITRGERQQAVVSAIADKIVSFNGYLRAPFTGDDVVKPLAMDLSAAQILQLAWIKFRTPSSGRLRCRLGGTAANIGGIDYIVGTEENVSVIAMVTGKSAPQPPKPASGPYGPGCIVGS
jgi:polyisoprenyl-teichoic acid--peptidoglycan teichoic acid transferase